MSDLTELAQQAIDCLDKQQEYFAVNYLADPQRKNELLRESRILEGALRRRCRAILNPPTQAALFDDEANESDQSATSVAALRR